jgi:hypothetical protein
MRYPASEKLEIIRLVERSSRPVGCAPLAELSPRGAGLLAHRGALLVARVFR